MSRSTVSFPGDGAAKANCEALVVVDVGETNTRAALFSLVEEKYRFIASTASPTTIYPPYNHPGYGVRAALEQLEKTTGQTLIGEDGRILSPRLGADKGVDGFSIVFSAGPPLRVVTAGLRADVSLESLGRLADSTYAQVVAAMHLGDGLAWEQRGEMLFRLAPDMVLIAGGYDGGAQDALQGFLKAVDLACGRLPKNARPVVIFAGNQAARIEVGRALAHVGDLELAANVRPSRDTEQLAPSQALMAQALRKDRLRRFPGFKTLDGWVDGGMVPFSTAFARSVRFLSLDDPSRAVLGVDLGTRKAVSALAYRGEVDVHVVTAPDGSEPGTIDAHTVRNVLRWLYMAVPEDEVWDYLANRALYPGSLPATFKDLAIEQALGRATLRKIARRIAEHLSRSPDSGGAGVHTSAFDIFDIEPIIAAGSLLTRAPSLGQSALMILDGLQPVGITSILLDPNHLLGALGAAMKINPELAVQVMDSNAFVNLGLVIAPAIQTEAGQPVLRLRMLGDGGKDLRIEVKQGELCTLPLTGEQQAQMWLKPLNGADIGLGPGKGCRLGNISGGALGVIIDCRGRPLRLPRDIDRRYSCYREWLKVLRG